MKRFLILVMIVFIFFLGCLSCDDDDDDDDDDDKKEPVQNPYDMTCQEFQDYYDEKGFEFTNGICGDPCLIECYEVAPRQEMYLCILRKCDLS